MRHSLFVVPLALLAAATAAAAQNAQARAMHTFVVSAAPGIGLFWRHSDATDLGLFLTGSVLSQDGQSRDAIAIEPTLRRYWRPDDRLTPYTHLALVGSWTDQKSDNTIGTVENRTLALGIEAGLGLEWFPIERVSIGGHAGVKLQQAWLRNVTPMISGPQVIQNQHQRTASTFQSGMQVRFYF
jgi:hypothetical protein